MLPTRVGVNRLPGYPWPTSGGAPHRRDLAIATGVLGDKTMGLVRGRRGTQVQVDACQQTLLANLPTKELEALLDTAEEGSAQDGTG